MCRSADISRRHFSKGRPSAALKSALSARIYIGTEELMSALKNNGTIGAAKHGAAENSADMFRGADENSAVMAPMKTENSAACIRTAPKSAREVATEQHCID